jgi:hypothetical protein
VTFQKKQMCEMKKLILFTFLAFLSCKKDSKIVKSEKNIYKDSILTVFDFTVNPKTDYLNAKKAASVLNRHFKKNGYLIASELDFGTFDPEAKEYFEKKAIDFIDSKPINNAATLVRYYNCEPFENGSCVLPHYAIIANTVEGYQILHQDFLPNNFKLDTIKKEKGKLFIYGYYYECANKKKLQSYRIAIK